MGVWVSVYTGCDCMGVFVGVRGYARGNVQGCNGVYEANGLIWGASNCVNFWWLGVFKGLKFR